MIGRTEPPDFYGRAEAVALGREDVSGALVETLTPIFARVLRRGPVSADADFFDLGGDSILAVELMLEIEAATGRNLPITVIYDAPTVRDLADVLSVEEPRDRSCLVLLKPGRGGPPLFIAHGLGGSVMELRAVALGIETTQAVYGIEARGLDGAAEPFDRIEDMAQFYVNAIRQLQPRGPYRLAGFSFGGLIALEMAQILSRSGETVDLLALLDSFPHTRYWPLRARIASWRHLVKISGSRATLTRLVRYHRAALRGRSPREKLGYIADRAARAARLSFNIFRLGAWLQRFADLSETGPTGDPVGKIAIPESVSRVQRAGEVAYARYRPRYYDGEIMFIKAVAERRVPFEAGTLWGNLAQRITVRAVLSDHQNLVRTGAAGLAHQLGSVLSSSGARRLTKP